MCRRQGKNNVETGNNVVNTELYPMMLESPQMRWAFIRKVYSILAFQLLLTAAVAFVIVLVRPISVFFATTTTGLVLYFVLLLSPLIVLWPLFYYHKMHPLNFFLLALFTITLSFGVGLSCAFTKVCVRKPRAQVETMEITLLLWEYRFGSCNSYHCGGRESHSVHILGCKERPGFQLPWSFLVCFSSHASGVCPDSDFLPPGQVIAIVFCGYIIYDTDNLIKRHSYDEYIWASVSLYLDIINLFLGLLDLFTAAD